MAKIASETILSAVDHRSMRIKLVVTAAGALLVLIAITAISVYKPWCITEYGRERLNKRKSERIRNTGKSKKLYLMSGLIILVLVVILVHLLNAGVGSHH
jgi:hypothetical protein